MPQAGGSLSNASLIGSLTDESTPKRSVPLDGYDALRILTRLYRFLLYGYQIENAKDLVARLDAERDVMRFRAQWTRELFGWTL